MDSDYSKRLSHQQLMYYNSKIIVYENNRELKKTSNVCFPKFKRQCISQRANRELKNCRFRQPLSTITRSTENLKLHECTPQSKQQIESVMILPPVQPSKVCGKQPFQPSNFKKQKKSIQTEKSKIVQQQIKLGKQQSSRKLTQNKHQQSQKSCKSINKRRQQSPIIAQKAQENELQMRIKLMRLFNPILLLQSDQKDLTDLDALNTKIDLYQYQMNEISCIPYFERNQQAVVRPSYLHMQLNKIRSQFVSKINKNSKHSENTIKNQEQTSKAVFQQSMSNFLKQQRGNSSLSNLNRDYTKIESYINNPNMNFFSTISGNFFQTSSTFHSKNSHHDSGSLYLNANQRAPIIRRMEGNSNKLKLFPKHVLQNQEFVDECFLPQNIKIQNYDGSIVWIRVPIRSQQTFQNNVLFPQKIKFPKAFLKIQEFYKDAPVFQLLNLLLFINSDIIKNIIQPSMAQHNSSYCCWLFQDGQFKPVIVDCAIPFNQQTLQPIFAWTQGYIWCSILLKCIAKCLGNNQQKCGYDRLLNLSASQLYKLITGFQMNRIKKQYLYNKKDIGQQIICSLNKGLIPVILKQGEYSVIKNIKHEKIVLLTPNKKDKIINLEEMMEDSYQLFLLKQEANWFIKQRQFPIQTDSIYACQIKLERHSKIHFIFNSLVKNIIIYEVCSKNKNSVKMNLKLSIQKNYLEGSFRRGEYKMFLQFEKKDLVEYFKSSSSFQKQSGMKSLVCKYTFISDQEIRVSKFEELKSNAPNMVEGEENLYKVPKFKNGRKSKI